MADTAHRISSGTDLLKRVSTPTVVVGVGALVLLIDMLLPWYAVGAAPYRQSSTGVSAGGVRFLALIGVCLVMAHFAFSRHLASRASAYYVLALSSAATLSIAWSFVAKSSRGFGEALKPSAGSFVPTSEINYQYGIFAAAAIATAMLVASVMRLKLANKGESVDQSEVFPVLVRVLFAIGFVSGAVLLLASGVFVLFSV